MHRKLMNVMLFLFTFAAVAVWGVASFAQSCAEDSGCQQSKLEAMSSSPVVAADPISSTQLKIYQLQSRLDSVLRIRDTVGDAKMFTDLDIYQEATEAMLAGEASAFTLKEIEKGLKPIEARILVLEKDLSR